MTDEPKPSQEPEAAGSACSAGLGRESEFEVRCNGEPVAWTVGPRARALAEASHYAAIYSQDGTVEVFEVFKQFTRMAPQEWGTT